MSNPKEAFGSRKLPLRALPHAATAELALAFGEGAIKYGPHNWRIIPVKASTYYEAALRHVAAWIEGDDTDPYSGISHVTKAIASLAILRDAQICGTLLDDRPPPAPAGFIESLNQAARDVSVMARAATEGTRNG